MAFKLACLLLASAVVGSTLDPSEGGLSTVGPGVDQGLFEEASPELNPLANAPGKPETEGLDWILSTVAPLDGFRSPARNASLNGFDLGLLAPPPSGGHGTGGYTLDPLALIRPQGFRGPGFNQINNPVYGGLPPRFGSPGDNFGPGGYLLPGNLHPSGFRGNAGPGWGPRLRGPGAFVPQKSPYGAAEYDPGQFRGPGVNVGPGNFGPPLFRPLGEPYGPPRFGPRPFGRSPSYPGPGGNAPGQWHPGGFMGTSVNFGPRRSPPGQWREGYGASDFNQINKGPGQFNSGHGGDLNPDGVELTLTAVDQTDDGLVYAEITVFVVSSEDESLLPTQPQDAINIGLSR